MIDFFDIIQYVKEKNIRSNDTINFLIDERVLKVFNFDKVKDKKYIYANRKDFKTLLINLQVDDNILFIISSKYYKDADIFNLLQEIELSQKKIIYWNINSKLLDKEELLNKWIKKTLFIDNEEIYQKNIDLKNKIFKTKEIVLITQDSILKFEVEKESVVTENGIINLDHILQFPYGEVFFPIKEKTCFGTISFFYKNTINVLEVNENVIDYSDNPIFLNKIISEFGIGTNFHIPSTRLLDGYEKKYGTCHLGFGSNLSFGGKIKENYHFDFVIKDFYVSFFDEFGNKIYEISN